MYYLKLFQNHSEYEEAKTSGLELPNVSHCINEAEVHYNPREEETKVVVKVNVVSSPTPTKICNRTSSFTEVEIDGVVQPTVVSGYTFDTTGEHTMKYTLADSTKIGNSAFRDCYDITSVIIPNNVTSIGNYAFDGCLRLTSVNIPSGVTSIGNSAFASCIRLTSVTIPSGVTSIDSGVFNGCSGLTSVTIPDSVTSIGDAAFNICYSLTSINIPSGVTSIGYYAFSGCRSLTSVTIPSGVTTILEGTFEDCSSLTSVTIPDSVTSIDNSAFYNCTSLTSVTSLATTAPTIKNNTFQNVKTNGTLTVPSGSSGYDVWMRTSNYYLGSYNWTKVEQ